MSTILEGIEGVVPSTTLPFQIPGFYTPLSSKTSIRLLRLESWTGDIPCGTLKVHDIENPPPFRALSYTWGPAYRDIDSREDDNESEARFTAEMIADGQSIAITENLRDALQSLVASSITGWIWIDALCINQGSFDERSSQVLLIGQIYSSANEVIVWLGKPKAGIDDYLWATTEFMPYDDDVSETEVLPTASHAIVQNWAKNLNNPIPRFVRVAEFYASCRWFSRAWIVQEVLSARKVRVFCGQVELSWRMMGRFADTLRAFGYQQAVNDYLASKGRGFPWNEEIYRLHIISLASVKDPKVITPRNLMNDNDRFCWLMQVLSTVRFSRCKDSRDKVYSVLGFVKRCFTRLPLEHYIRPDYTVSVEQVYIKFAVEFFKHVQFLDALMTAGRGLEDWSQLDLPSWVFDFSRPHVAQGLSGLPDQLTSALKFDAALCESRNPSPRKISTSTLSCLGARFGTVEEVYEHELAALTSCSSLDLVLDFCLSLPEKLNGRRRLEVLSRTLIADTTEGGYCPAPSLYEKRFLLVLIGHLATRKLHPDPSIFSELSDIVSVCSKLDQLEINKESSYPTIEDSKSFLEVYHMYEAYGQELIRTGQHQNEVCEGLHRAILSFLGAMSKVGLGRRLFRTKEGILGLGFSTVKPYDEVWLLCDAHTPFVLRPTAESSSFTVHGDCYIHDLMRGEMLDDKWGLKEKIGPVNLI